MSKDELALYDLIWRRFVASQMAPAVFQLTTVDMHAGDYLFRATASILQFPGFTAVYQESREDEDEEAAAKLPPLKEGEVLELRDFDPQQHFTKPPPRYTEASLIKELEVQGIGRPSTYATILSNLQDRLYVVKEKATLRPMEMGLVVSDLLVENFPGIMDPKFTAGHGDGPGPGGRRPGLLAANHAGFLRRLCPGTGGGQRRDAPGEERPHRAQMSGLRRRAGGALGQKRRIFGLLRLPQVRLHRGFYPGCQRTHHGPG